MEAILRLGVPMSAPLRMDGSDVEEVLGGDVILVAKRLAAIRDITRTCRTRTRRCAHPKTADPCKRPA